MRLKSKCRCESARTLAAPAPDYRPRRGARNPRTRKTLYGARLENDDPRFTSAAQLAYKNRHLQAVSKFAGTRALKTIPWWEPEIGEAERDLVVQVLASNFVNDGDVTTRFERRVVELLGCRYAVGVTNCTSAIFLALVAAGVGPGDEVIVPDATFIATANAVSMAGAKAVLVDIEPETLTMSAAAFADAITPRTKAVVPVHVSGRGADLDAIMAIAAANGVTVVEDAAEAFLSRRNGRALGTFGAMGCLSFSPMKLITTGQGGMVITDDDALHLRLRQLKDQGRSVRGTGGDDPHPIVGYNFKLTNLQAALGLGQLETLDRRMDHVRRMYSAYKGGLEGLNAVRVLPCDTEGGALPLWVDVIVERCAELVPFLRERGIDCRPFWHPIHTQPCYRLPDERFPVATEMLPKAVWLPSAFSVSEADVARVCETIREFLAG